MKVTTAGFIVLIAALGAVSTYHKEEDLPALYLLYMEKWDRNWDNDMELLTHYDAFKNTVKFMQDLKDNTQSSSLNDLEQFADFTVEELKEFLDDNDVYYSTKAF